MGFLQEFKEFAMKGNALDMAVGIIIGAAFNKIVQSLVNDVIMPPLGWLINGVDFKDLSLTLQKGVPAHVDANGAQVAEVATVAIKYGAFINEVINFLIVAFTVFIMVKFLNKMMAMRPKMPFGRGGDAADEAPKA
ncbi:MAG: large-conductance mechanosensitive channel protein MscL [Phycisphaerales bacterium]|nr:large-conductance mechanosensitive channel protein MscL [Phycisphaerales bacterium]MCB9840414.1 large-conductance mechanosensitive channel protein MscL [Phycisphaeraceae bacterium]